jgi:outer membrane murein-binding lipoprotein Lpp
MANTPSKRRGISLDPRVDSTVSPDLLSGQPTHSQSSRSDQPPTETRTALDDSGITPTMVARQVVALRRANADLRRRWRRQSEQLQRHLELLEQQRDQIALQTLQLQALERGRKRSGRIGTLLALLLAVAAGALAFHHWPQVQELASDWNRMSARTDQLAPELQAMRGQLATLSTDMGRMGGAITSLKEDVSGVRVDLGAMREDVDTAKAQARSGDAGSTRRGVPQDATTMSNPYRGMHPRMPW